MKKTDFKRILFPVVCVFVLPLLFSGCSKETPQENISASLTPEPNSHQAGYLHVDADEAERLIASGEGILVDVRTEIPFNMEHIPGAVNIPYTEVSDDPDELIEGLPDKDMLIIVYCDYGGSSKEVAEKMAAKGYTNVVEFDGLLVWEGETVSS